VQLIIWHFIVITSYSWEINIFYDITNYYTHCIAVIIFNQIEILKHIFVQLEIITIKYDLTIKLLKIGVFDVII